MRIDVDRIKKESTNKWRGIYESFGIEVPPDSKTHGPCPICGPGNNSHRFRMDDQDGSGSFICTQCGAGQGFTLLMLKFGWTFIDAVKEVGKVVNTVEFTPAPKEQYETKKREFMNKIWKDSGPLTGGDFVTKYLRSRGIVISPDISQVHLNASCYEAETKTSMSAMVCMVRDRDGKPTGLHRTYLTDKATKAELKNARKSIGKTANGAIRLMPVTDTVGVAEGIETAMSATQLFDIPTWAVISAGGMESFMPPEGVRKVVIFSDNDASFTGQKSAYFLANKLYLKDYIVDDPQIPDIRGEDWNDVLMREMNKHNIKSG